MKLGKQQPQIDSRNLKLAQILRADAPEPPARYDVDDLYGPKHLIPNGMYANDLYGCCVIAGRAHQTRRLELLDANVGGLVGISDEEVIREYLKESGGKDSGLIVLSSLKLWRTAGWLFPVQKIDAFAELNRFDHAQVKRGIIGSAGIGIGLGLPEIAQDQFNAHRPWTLVEGGAQTKPYSWGGHYVYVVGYNETGPVCITWARRQQMTWDFFDEYCDEAYLVVDALTPRRGQVDHAKVSNYLASL